MTDDERDKELPTHCDECGHTITQLVSLDGILLGGACNCWIVYKDEDSGVVSEAFSSTPFPDFNSARWDW